MEISSLKKIEFIARHYGYDAQSRQCIEEMAELTQAINKFWRKQLNCGGIQLPEVEEKISIFTKDYADIVEEIADVEITLEQMKVLLHCEQNVTVWIENKLSRQLKRIEGTVT